ncbi:hypothetical protein RB597_001220 [Gaeumannomyces tritici]
MAGVADKARFYLEQAVPQLREFEDKEIFNRDEIRNLVRKRTDFEHRVLSPGSRAADFLAYAEWESRLETLRARRCARLGVRQLTHQHASPARLNQLHERGVTRDPGSVALWRSYLAHLARIGAAKRWRRVATRALRLHPQDASLWALAGRRAAGAGDMDGARAYFMRGCRFCRGVDIWAEYARVEIEWLARVEARGKGRKGIAAVQAVQAAQAVDEGDRIKLKDDDESDDDDDEDDEDVIPDPDRLAFKELEKKKLRPRIVDEDAVAKLKKSPALGGAIPRAIFDISRKQTFFDAAAAETFFNVFARRTTDVESCPDLLQHVVDTMVELFPAHPATWDCRVRQPLVVIDDLAGPALPGALREALARLKEGLAATGRKAELAARTVAWVQPMLSRADLDEGIRTVLEHTKKKMGETS